MTGLQHEVDHPEVTSIMVRQTRAAIPRLVHRATLLIQDSVQPYSGPETGRRHRLIEMATAAAISHFLDTIERPGTPSRSVDELFRRMGHGEASEGHDLTSMQAAFRIVNHEAWDLLRTYASTQNWSATMLGTLSEGLFLFTEHLYGQAQLGFDGAMRAFEQDPARARAKLVEALLGGAPLAEIQSQSVKAGWTLPDMFIVFALSSTDDEPMPDLTDLPGHHLLRSDPLSAVIVADPADRSELLSTLRERSALRIATSWPVVRDDVPDAWRWVRRAHELVDRGVIAPDPVVDCAEHRTQLWLHAEPSLRQRLCQDLLRPLLAETPNSREILSETLLAWLESRDSAPAIAAKLGVHPQTVRYRWKRINELFGEDLREPEFVVQATMLLKASVPLWKAGDQSDFERFRTEDLR